MADKWHSEPGIFGGYTHYDDKGHKIGKSEPGIFGDYTLYDAKGNKIGRSEQGVFGDFTHYDSHGHKIGRSDRGVFDGFTHYDSSGHKVGSSTPKVTGGYTHNSGSEGCYVATCVYGSYDCPEVWTLRRFRDSYLKQHLLGRAFVRAYYAISPKIVARRGKSETFRIFWRKVLNRFVAKLNEIGYSGKEYID